MQSERHFLQREALFTERCLAEDSKNERDRERRLRDEDRLGALEQQLWNKERELSQREAHLLQREAHLFVASDHVREGERQLREAVRQLRQGGQQVCQRCQAQGSVPARQDDSRKIAALNRDVFRLQRNTLPESGVAACGVNSNPLETLGAAQARAPCQHHESGRGQVDEEVSRQLAAASTTPRHVRRRVGRLRRQPRGEANAVDSDGTPTRRQRAWNDNTTVEPEQAHEQHAREIAGRCDSDDELFPISLLFSLTPACLRSGDGDRVFLYYRALLCPVFLRVLAMRCCFAHRVDLELLST
jgi:hypothetical protein